MSDPIAPYPLLDLLYQRYLNSENTADFVRDVAQSYSIGTLEKLATQAKRVTRRAAILAIGFLGDFHCNSILGDALHDRDRAVRLLADHGIRGLWFRVDNPVIREQLESIAQLNLTHRYTQCVLASDSLLNEQDDIAEVWNQRAVAHFALEDYTEAINDCWRTLELNPYHFSAALGLAHCHMNLNEATEAIDGFRVALNINPNLENVRAQIDHLQRML